MEKSKMFQMRCPPLYLPVDGGDREESTLSLEQTATSCSAQLSLHMEGYLRRQTLILVRPFLASTFPFLIYL